MECSGDGSEALGCHLVPEFLEPGMRGEVCIEEGVLPDLLFGADWLASLRLGATPVLPLLDTLHAIIARMRLAQVGEPGHPAQELAELGWSQLPRLKLRDVAKV